MNWADLVEKARERTPLAVYGNGMLVVPAGFVSQLPRFARQLRADYQHIRTTRGEYELVIAEQALPAWDYVVTGDESQIAWSEQPGSKAFRTLTSWRLRTTATGHLIAVKSGRRRAFVLTTQRVVKRFVYRAPLEDVEKVVNCKGVWAEAVDAENGPYLVWLGGW